MISRFYVLYAPSCTHVLHNTSAVFAIRLLYIFAVTSTCTRVQVYASALPLHTSSYLHRILLPPPNFYRIPLHFTIFLHGTNTPFRLVNVTQELHILQYLAAMPKIDILYFSISVIPLYRLSSQICLTKWEGGSGGGSRTAPGVGDSEVTG
jgi:hypothetical protein